MTLYLLYGTNHLPYPCLFFLGRDINFKRSGLGGSKVSKFLSRDGISSMDFLTSVDVLTNS